MDYHVVEMAANDCSSDKGECSQIGSSAQSPLS